MIVSRVTSHPRDLIAIITRAINARTHRRVTNLEVSIENHRPAGELPVLRIKGQTGTYHIKQLAQVGAFEFLEQDNIGLHNIVNEIRVV